MSHQVGKWGFITIANFHTSLLPSWNLEFVHVASQEIYFVCYKLNNSMMYIWIYIYITIYIYYIPVYIFTDTNNLTPKLFYHILGKYSPGWKESPCHQGQKISRIWKSCKEPRLRNQWPTLGPHGGFLGHVSWDVWAEPLWLCLRVFLLRMIWINIISCTDEYHLCILFWRHDENLINIDDCKMSAVIFDILFILCFCIIGRL